MSFYSSSKRPRKALRIVELLEEEDRLSNLHEDLLHRILSLIPTVDAVRTSLLSKQWRRTWRSLPSLDYDENRSVKKFCTLVTHSMRARKNDILSRSNYTVSRFRLAMKPTWKIVDVWLKMLGESKIRDVEIEFYPHPVSSGRIYNSLTEKKLPAKWLTKLRLVNADLTGLSTPIRFPKLGSLILIGVRLDDRVVHGFSSGSPLLEKLVLSRCSGSSDLRFLSPSLKFLEIDSTPARRIHITAKNLESLVFNGSSWMIFETLEKLRTLSLSSAALGSNQLVGLISRLPALENLTLSRCESKEFKIHSQRLKSLDISPDLQCVKIDIDTPDLVYFRFSGSPLVKLLLRARNISRARIEFHETEYDRRWFLSLLWFLSQLNLSISLSLHVKTEEAFIFPDDFRNYSKRALSNVKDLKVVVQKQSRRRRDLMESMSWMTSN